jgi:hypothetical protein
MWAAIYPPGRFLVLISVRGWVDPHGHSVAERIRSFENSSDLIRNRTRDLLPSSIVPQRTMLSRAPICIILMLNRLECLRKLSDVFTCTCCSASDVTLKIYFGWIFIGLLEIVNYEFESVWKDAVVYVQNYRVFGPIHRPVF